MACCGWLGVVSTNDSAAEVVQETWLAVPDQGSQAELNAADRSRTWVNETRTETTPSASDDAGRRTRDAASGGAVAG